MPEVTVIIVSYNSQPLLAKCLESVFASGPGLSLEVTVVDNASTDSTVAFLKEHYPQVRLICNSENRGFAAANNQAIRQSQSPYVVLLNPDTWLLNDALTALRDYLEKHERVGAVGPRMEDGAGRRLASAHGFETLATLAVAVTGAHRLLPRGLRQAFAGLLGKRGADYRRNFEAAEPAAVGWLSGACLMVRRTACEQAGLLDESYMMYMEDEEWCWRLGRHGWQVVYVPAARIVHDVSYGPGSAAKARFLFASSRSYHRRHNRLMYPLIYALLTCRYLRDLSRARA